MVVWQHLEFPQKPITQFITIYFYKAALAHFTTFNSILIRPCIMHSIINFESMFKTAVCAVTGSILATMAIKPGWYHPGKATSSTGTFPATGQGTSNDWPGAGSEISWARRGQQAGRLLHPSPALWEFSWNMYMTSSGLWINFFG